MIERTEKKRRGRSVVIGILVLATLGAGLTWRNYKAQAPSTTNALLLSDDLVLATFRSQVAHNVRAGAKAIVTIENSPGKRLEGVVQSLETKEPDTKVLIKLDNVFPEARPHTRCSVTVDTSVSSKIMKSD